MSLAAPSHDILASLRAQDGDLYLVTLLCPSERRAALATLFAWDATLATAAAASPEAMVNCIRLAWWREQMEGLDPLPADARLPAPLLEDVRRHLLPLGITSGQLAALEAPWADILEEDTPATSADLSGWCCARGGGLFDLACQLLAPQANEAARQTLHAWGHIWALAQWLRSGPLDFTLPLTPAPCALPAALRPLAALGQLSLRDVKRHHHQPTAKVLRKASPARLMQLLFFSLRNR